MFAFDPTGAPAGRYRAAVGVTGIARAGPDWLVLGYRDGNIELLPTDAEKPKPAYSFEPVPASAVLRIVPGPMRTIVVAYANGVAVFTAAKGGLMYEAAIGGQKFSFEAK